jgi:hypothetical protein
MVLRVSFVEDAMGRWKKSPPELIARFEAALPRDPHVEPKKMFGYPAAFVSGGFFTGLHEHRVVLRLPADVHAQTKALAGAAAFDPMGGRPMRGWYVVPDAIAGDAKKLGALLAEVLPKLVKHPEQPSAKKRAADKPAAPKKAAPRKPAAKKAAPRRRARG